MRVEAPAGPMRGWVLLAAILMAGCLGNTGTDSASDPCADGGVVKDYRTCTGCPWIDGCAIPDMDANPEVVLTMNGTYRPGEMATVHARNVGNRTYTHYAEATCHVGFYTDSGRQFIVRPRSHCDIANRLSIYPGEDLVLFLWPLDECHRTNWGCADNAPLPPGEYHLRATFCAVMPEEPEPGQTVTQSPSSGCATLARTDTSFVVVD